ncbi:MAG: hypothetical protein EBR30_14550 [Cytophagia bacterium]|nr:hypothetical protein [Cytophagia bacterium]
MKKNTLSSVVLILIIGLLTTNISAQDNIITIRVVDNLTKKPVKDAAIQIKDSITLKTNYLGYSQGKAIPGDTILISCSDYYEKWIIVPTEQKFQIGIDKTENKLDFTGGIKSFYEHLGENLKYPSIARSKKRQADIYVEFKVDSTGQSILIKIHNDTSNLFEKDITRAFNSLPGKWSVDYSNKIFLLPIRYRLQSLAPPNDNSSNNVFHDRKLSEIVVTAY